MERKKFFTHRFLPIFSIFLFIIFIFTNVFASSIETIDFSGKNYPIYYDIDLDSKYAIDISYPTYVTVKKDGIYYLIIVSQPESLLISDTNKLVNSSGYNLTVRYYVYNNDYDTYFPTGSYGAMGYFVYDELIYNVSDLYKTDGSLYAAASDYDSFFHRAPQGITRTLVEESARVQIADQLKTMTAGYLKYLIALVISVIAFWKGWQFLSTQLRKA